MRLHQFYLMNSLKLYGSISRTAKELMISQPSISRAIQELEKELGCEILIRSAQGVCFTKQGEKILELSEQIMAATESMKFVGAQDPDVVTGEVKISCTPFFCSHLVLDSVLATREKYPGLDIHVQVYDGIGIVQNVLMNQSDIGIVLVNAYDKVGFFHEFRRHKMAYIKLFDDQFVFFAKKDHPLCSGKDISMKELVNYPYITYKERFSDLTLNLFSTYGYQYKIISINDWETIKRYLSLTEAFSTMPKRIFDKSMEYDKNFSWIMVQDFHWKCAAYLIYRKDELSKADSIFLDMLRLKAKNYD